jgi:hypothetical protein
MTLLRWCEICNRLRYYDWVEELVETDDGAGYLQGLRRIQGRRTGNGRGREEAPPC